MEITKQAICKPPCLKVSFDNKGLRLFLPALKTELNIPATIDVISKSIGYPSNWIIVKNLLQRKYHKGATNPKIKDANGSIIKQADELISIPAYNQK